MNRRLAIALLIAGATLVLAACSPPSLPPGATPTPKPLVHVKGSGVAFDAPLGWAYTNASPRGPIVALAYADLTADTTGGPRLVASRADGHLPNASALFATIRAQQQALHGAPQTVAVDGRAGVAVESETTIGETVIFARTVLVPLGDGHVEVFILEAPADQWTASLATLEAILASVRFSATPAIAPSQGYPYSY